MARGKTMKAITRAEYGGPEVLSYAEVSDPTPGPRDVLVRLRASSINAADYRMMRADPFLVRLETGLFRPKKWHVLGSDVAGVVERVGAEVDGLEVGDEVFGNSFQSGLNAFAELVVVRADHLVAKPDHISFDEAAAVPLAGITALQAIRDAAQVEPGQSVLIQGASGGVGGFALQIAVAFGGEVTAVCGAESMELARDQGAIRVIDYRETDFTDESIRYDTIIGINGYHSLRDYKRCLNPGGIYVMVGGDNRQIYEGMFLSWLVFLFGNRRATNLNVDDDRRAEDLGQLRKMLIDGELQPVVDRTFDLDEAADAMRYLEQHHVDGKVALRVEE
jgi:NADPH:quinone reductase-like Zn-dependent oxidoreductase